MLRILSSLFLNHHCVAIPQLFIFHFYLLIYKTTPRQQVATPLQRFALRMKRGIKRLRIHLNSRKFVLIRANSCESLSFFIIHDKFLTINHLKLLLPWHYQRQFLLLYNEQIKSIYSWIHGIRQKPYRSKIGWDFRRKPYWPWLPSGKTMYVIN